MLLLFARFDETNYLIWMATAHNILHIWIFLGIPSLKQSASIGVQTKVVKFTTFFLKGTFPYSNNINNHFTKFYCIIGKGSKSVDSAKKEIL